MKDLIKGLPQKNISLIAFLCASSAYVIFWISAMYISYCYGDEKRIHANSVLFISCLLVFISQELYIRIGDWNKVRPLRVLFGLFSVIFIVMLRLYKAQILGFVGKYAYNYTAIFIASAFFIWLRGFLADKDKLYYFKVIKNVFVKYIEIPISVVLFSIVYYFQVRGFHPRWDAKIVIMRMNKEQGVPIFNFNEGSIGSISRMFYVTINNVFNMIFDDEVIAVKFVQYFVFILGMLCMYGLVRYLFPSKKKFEQLLLTSIFAFSPYALGLCSEMLWDYWMVMLLPIVLYTYVSKKYILHFFSAFVFVFTKEVGCIIYFGLILGFLINDLRNIKENKIKVFFQIKYFAATCIGLVWVIIMLMSYIQNMWIPALNSNYKLFTYILLIVVLTISVIVYFLLCERKVTDNTEKESIKSGVLSKVIIGLVAILFCVLAIVTWKKTTTSFRYGTIAFNVDEFILKLKTFFVINFNWLVTIGIILGFGILLKDKGEESNNRKNLILPIILADFLLVAFNMAFSTYIFARYVDSHVSLLYILLIMVIGLISNKKLSYGINIIVSLLLLVQSYRTIDPMTLLMFDHVKYGKSDIVSTDGTFWDAALYNAQWSYLPKTLNKAIEEPINEGKLICFPNAQYAFEAITDSAFTCNEKKNCYWDTKYKIRRLYETKDCIPLEVAELYEDDGWDELTEYKDAYYFYAPFTGEDKAEKLRQDGVVLDEKEFWYMGFVITRVHFQYEK